MLMKQMSVFVENTTGRLADLTGVLAENGIDNLKNGINAQDSYSDDFDSSRYAAVLLQKYPNLSISEISDQCGFSTSVYFSRCFKDFYGVSPKTYRKKDFEE